MTDDLRFERDARDWLELGPVEAPFDVIQAALLEIDSTPQERDLRVPWRFPIMPTFARAFAAAAVIVGLVAGGALFLQRSNPAFVGGPSPSLSATSTSTPTPLNLDAITLSAAFTSDRYGYTLPVNPGWATHQAMATWTGPDNSTPVIDEVTIPGTQLYFNGASQALAAGQTLDAWLDSFQTEGLSNFGCLGGPASTWPTRQIGGREWRWEQGCRAAWAITEESGRVYVFGCGGCAADSTDVSGLFERLLSAAQIHPELAPPPPSPPPLTQAFVADRNGFRLQVPASWSVVQRATQPAPRDRLPILADVGLDVLGNDQLRLSVTSFPLGEGETADEWAHAFCAVAANVWSRPCDQAPGAWETVPLKSGTAWIIVNGETAGAFPQNDSRLFLATTVTGGRAYEIRLEGTAERTLFLAILASMELDPAAASPATPRP